MCNEYVIMCIMSRAPWINGVERRTWRTEETDRPRVANTRTALTTQLDESTGVAVADHSHSPANQKGGSDMPDDLKGAIDQIANSLQTVTLLSTQLRRDLGESAQRAVELEAAADQAVRVLKRLQPKKPR